MIRTPSQMAARLDRPDIDHAFAAGYWRSAYEALHAEYMRLEAKHNSLHCEHCGERLDVDDLCESCGHDKTAPEDCECKQCEADRDENAADREAQGARPAEKGWMP